MDGSRYFVISDLEAYEASRLAVDAARNVPTGETTYEPLDRAQRDNDGNVLLAVRSMHCDLPAIASAISQMLANGWGEEISEQEYRDSLPPQGPLSP